MDLVHDRYIATDPARTDRSWNWRYQIPLLLFAGLIRRPRMFQIATAQEDFPLAMVALLENERWIGNHTQTAVYVWYVTAAPPDAVRSLGRPGMMTRAAIDVAVQVALAGPARGRLWLHAAPEGGEKLLGWYRSLGFDSVPPETTLPQPIARRRDNDGRYLSLDFYRSLALATSMNGYR